MRTTIIALVLLAIIATISARCCPHPSCLKGGVCPKMCYPCKDLLPDFIRRPSAAVESDISLDEIINYVNKAKQIHDIIKGEEEAEEESDLKINWKKVGNVALKAGKLYANAHGIPLSEESAEEESDIKFKKILGKVGKTALSVGKQYVGNKYGIQLADSELNLDEFFSYIEKAKKIHDIIKGEEEAEEESDLKINWKKVGKTALNIGKQYVGNKYGIQLNDESDPAIYPEDAMSESESANGQSAANWARGKVGGCYSQTQRDGNPCYDCSSLVYYAWRAAGKNIGATNTRMYPGNTRRVNDLQPGDILWKSGHVGMYVGNNQVVNAENPNSGIKLRDLGWYKTYIGYSVIYRPN